MAIHSTVQYLTLNCTLNPNIVAPIQWRRTEFLYYHTLRLLIGFSQYPRPSGNSCSLPPKYLFCANLLDSVRFQAKTSPMEEITLSDNTEILNPVPPNSGFLLRNKQYDLCTRSSTEDSMYLHRRSFDSVRRDEDGGVHFFYLLNSRRTELIVPPSQSLCDIVYIPRSLVMVF